MRNKEQLIKIVKPLVKWYQENKRELPWRQKKDAYFVWISEIMLQQTKIEAVKPYYERFQREIPNIKALANIEEEKLLKLWEGLGYYNRARNLKKAAQIIEQNYEGNMPTTYEELVKLPGIGEYTAGAIASIAYQEKVPAVDGNVLRVISRITASEENILEEKIKKEVSKELKEIMPEEAGDFNEALMELGETICIPNGEPECSKCPVKKECIAWKEERTQELPIRIKKMKRTAEERTVFLLKKDKLIAIRKREEKGLLAGMYEFPNIDGKLKKQEIKEQLEKWDLKPKKEITNVGTHKHVFSHKDWNLIAYEIEVMDKNEEFLWVTQNDLKEKFAMPNAFAVFQETKE